MPSLAEFVDVVVGVDTHRDTHQVEMADHTGAPLGFLQIRNDDGGFLELLAWIGEKSPGPRIVVSMEGSRSYGIGLSRALTAVGIPVLECEQPHHRQRRGKGKSDPIDAHLAVLTALRLDSDRLPALRADGDREALRILLGARHDLVTSSTAQINRLRALLLSGDDLDREHARGPLNHTTLGRLSRRRLPTAARRDQAVRHAEVRRLAHAIQAANQALRENSKQLTALVDAVAPGLTSLHGVGPVSAAQAVVSFSHPGRCRNDAAFAALSGTAPIPASSGQTTRHRLNRGGDRALNRAIHTIALTRIRSCDNTRAYVERRTAEGKSSREIRRCLKRYIARQLYRQLTQTMTPQAP